MRQNYEDCRSQTATIYSYCAAGDSHLMDYGSPEDNKRLNTKDGVKMPELTIFGDKPRRRRAASIVAGTNSYDWLKLLPWWGNSRKPFYLISLGGNDIAQGSYHLSFSFQL